MPSAHLLRLQIESALASRIPSALTPAPRVIRPTAPTGISALDEALRGGLPIGAISELSGPECSGRTSLALSFIAGLTQAGRVCAWVDASDSLDPESAAALGVDLDRFLWIRCGAEAQQLSLPGFSETPVEQPLPQSTTTSGAPSCPPLAGWDPATPASPETFSPRCAEPQPRRTPVRRPSRERSPTLSTSPVVAPPRVPHPARIWQGREKPYSRLDQALRATDLLLQGGGFSAIVLDMGSIAPEFALRVPLATWFRYRAAAERTHASVLLLTQQVCTKSSAGLVLHLAPGPRFDEGGTVLSSAEYRVEIARERFSPGTRKPPQSERGLRWQSHAPWTAHASGRKAGRS